MGKEDTGISEKIQKLALTRTTTLSKLQRSHDKFKTIMELSDAEIKEENKPNVDYEKFSFYSHAPSDLKEKIRSRTLTESEYVSILFSQATPVPVRISREVPTPYRGRAPLHIPRDIPLRLRVKADSVQSFCKEHHLNFDGLSKVVDLVTSYQTNLPTIGRILEKGYSLRDIEAFMITRSELSRTSTESNSVDAPTLNALISFHETFFGGEVDSRNLIPVLGDILITLEQKIPGHKPLFRDSIIRSFIQEALKMGVSDYSILLSAIAIRQCEGDYKNLTVVGEDGVYQEKQPVKNRMVSDGDENPTDSNLGLGVPYYPEERKKGCTFTLTVEQYTERVFSGNATAKDGKGWN